MSCVRYVCNKCKVEVGAEHFTAEDGRILCEKCNVGVEPCSERIKKLIKELDEK